MTMLSGGWPNGAVIQAVFAYVLIAGFFGLEILLRRGAAARSVEATDSDKGSTRLIGVAFAVALILPPILNRLRLGVVAGVGVRWLGLIIMVLGLGLRVWSMRVLGEYYSRTLRVGDAQEIVTRGPYRIVRHPGYTGTLLLWIGSGLALGNWIAAAAIAALMLGIFSYRIRSEESMLLMTFGQRYQLYRQHTWTLVPFVY